MKSRVDFARISPQLLRPLLALEAQVEASGLEHALLELVKMRASQINGCAYCLDMHSKDARAAGESEQRLYLLDAWRETSLYTERERAALAWTEAVTLVADGMLEQNPDTGKYRLGLSLFRLGSLVRRRMSVSNEARPLLRELREKVNETVHLAVLDGTEIMYVFNLESTQSIRMRSDVGVRKPAYCTAEGQAILAWQAPEVVEQVVARPHPGVDHAAPGMTGRAGADLDVRVLALERHQPRAVTPIPEQRLGMRQVDMQAGRAVAGLAAYVDFGPGGVKRVARQVVVLLQVRRVAVGAHVVPVLLAAGPVQWIVGRDFFVGVEVEPAFVFRVPGDRQRL